MGTHFPAKCAKTARGVFRNERLGTLNRLNYFEAETHPAEQNRPWVPHAGGQDDGSLHKLPQISNNSSNTDNTNTNTNIIWITLLI